MRILFKDKNNNNAVVTVFKGYFDGKDSVCFVGNNCSIVVNACQEFAEVLVQELYIKGILDVRNYEVFFHDFEVK